MAVSGVAKHQLRPWVKEQEGRNNGVFKKNVRKMVIHARVGGGTARHKQG